MLSGNETQPTVPKPLTSSRDQLGTTDTAKASMLGFEMRCS